MSGIRQLALFSLLLAASACARAEMPADYQLAMAGSAESEWDSAQQDQLSLWAANDTAAAPSVDVHASRTLSLREQPKAQLAQKKIVTVGQGRELVVPPGGVSSDLAGRPAGAPAPVTHP